MRTNAANDLDATTGTTTTEAPTTTTAAPDDAAGKRTAKGDELDDLTREQLNAHALNCGISDPASHDSKAALIEAIRLMEEYHAS